MGRGRPRFTEGVARSSVIETRTTTVEANRWKRAAKSDRCTLSDWIRDVLNRKVGIEPLRTSAKSSPSVVITASSDTDDHLPGSLMERWHESRK